MRVVAVLVLAVAACGGSSTPPPAVPPPANIAPAPALATEDELTAIENRLCKCRDRTCLAAAIGELDDVIVTAQRGYELAHALDNCVELGTTAIDDLTALRDRACKCGDAACAQAVETDFSAFIERNKDTKGSQQQADHVTKLATEMSECVQRAMGGGAP